MKRRRKLLSILLSLSLVVGMIPAFGVTAFAAPTVSSITINADYTYLIVGSYTVPPNFDLYSNAGDIHFDRGNSYWKKYNESTGKYERYMKKTVEPGEYVYSYSLYIKKTEGIPASSVTVRINGKSQTVSFKGPDDYGNYYVNVDDTVAITPRTLPSLTGKVTLDCTEDPIPANRIVKAVLSGGLEDLPSSEIYYQWEWKMEDGTPGTFDGATSQTFRLTEDHLGDTIRVRVFAEGYSGYVYSSWREVGEPVPNNITVVGGTAKKKTAMAFDKVALTAIPNNNDFAFDRWTAAKGDVIFDNGYSAATTFTMPLEDVAISGNYKVKSTAGTNSWSGKTNPFVDVSKGTYYYDPVLWAYYASPQVTNGMDETHFGPMSTVTRGQCVTFLWRAKGCPEPTTKTNPFMDVPEKEYYYKPILWAVEKGITKGTDANHFSPNQKLSTAHIVTFLYRTLEKGTDGWYKEAGNWAKSDGLLDGTGLGVSDQTDCPRGAVVTFLYRELANAASGVNELSKDDFLMYVEEYFNVTGRGRVVTGKVLNGSIRVGNKVTLISFDETTKAPTRVTYTVDGIEMFRRNVDEARKGDNAGILLSSDASIKTPKGSALVNQGSSLKSSPGRFVGTVKMNNESNTKTLTLGDTFQVYWTGYDVTAMLVDLNGSDLKPDTTREGVRLTLLYPEVFYIGQELKIREGGRTYGTFTVTGIE